MRFLLLLSALAASPAAAQFQVAETGANHESLQDAVNAIGTGSGTIRIAPGMYDDCAVQEYGRVAYVAATPGTVVFDGGTCEGKATLVLRGRGARVHGVTFTRMFVEDGNGAGIRIEKGDLAVSETKFADSQGGILSANDPTSSISIDRSTFTGLGKHPDGNGAHGLYVNNYGSLKVTNSRFERGTGGHYLKSRARRIEIVGNSFDDSKGRDTNYLIDLSNGAVGRISGNTFVNGRGKENYSTMVTVAPEGSNQPSKGLVIENNDAKVVPDFPWTTTFVGSWTGEKLVVRNNRIGRKVSEFARN